MDASSDAAGSERRLTSWELVAEARQAWVDELRERVERFASGRDRSERYARELGEWLALHHGGDARFTGAISALAEYRTKIGYEQASEICRRLLDTVRRDLEGPHRDWRSVAEFERAHWREAFAGATGDSRVDRLCPACGGASLRRYYRRYSQSRGGGWEWCANCLRYEHYQAAVPGWWAGDPQLDDVPLSLLAHTPEFLQRALDEPSVRRIGIVLSRFLEDECDSRVAAGLRAEIETANGMGYRSFSFNLYDVELFHAENRAKITPIVDTDEAPTEITITEFLAALPAVPPDPFPQPETQGPIILPPAES